jgi:hypothetical protein
MFGFQPVAPHPVLFAKGPKERLIRTNKAAAYGIVCIWMSVSVCIRKWTCWGLAPKQNKSFPSL